MATMLEDFKNTYQEKSYLPNVEFKNGTGLPIGCPHHYGYEKENVEVTCNVFNCYQCWDRELVNE